MAFLKANPEEAERLFPHNDNIVDKIIAEIRTCQFMVADFSGQKAGVYFEAGFAKG